MTTASRVNAVLGLASRIRGASFSTSKVYHVDDHAVLLVGDCRAEMRSLAPGIARTCVTSPPYWKLRDYGVAGQLGAEATPEEYVANLVDVFREVRRLLTDDGTLWLNLGDSYIGKQLSKRVGATNMKPKDMVGIPWMVAFALRADGWYLRSDIIWQKPNTMPEPVVDRPTKAHEYLFLLAKSRDYYYNIDAIREPHTMKPQRRLSPIENRPKFGQRQAHTEAGYRTRKDVGVDGHSKGRNRRTVWSINTRPFKGAHFATMPPALVEPCILAGSAPGDIVLDPFSGAGTTWLVARQRGRLFVGTELNPRYAAISVKRAEDAEPRTREIVVTRRIAS